MLATPQPLAGTLPLPPQPMPAWEKALLYITGSYAHSLLSQAFTSAQEIKPLTPGDTSGLVDEWRRCQVRWEDTTSVDTADDQWFTVDIVNYTGGAVDSSWTLNDYLTVDGHLFDFVTAVAASTVTHLTNTERRYYRMGFHDYTYRDPVTNKPVVFVDSGPPEYIGTSSVAGLAASIQAAQISSTITERTPSRRNWGRLYLPTVASGQLVAGGLYSQSYVDGIVAAYDAMVVALAPQGFYLTVPTSFVGKVETRTLQIVTQVAADNIPDVQRRRRKRNPTYQKILP